MEVRAIYGGFLLTINNDGCVFTVLASNLAEVSEVTRHYFGAEHLNNSAYEKRPLCRMNREKGL
jgi:hypothetical protein